MDSPYPADSSPFEALLGHALATDGIDDLTALAATICRAPTAFVFLRDKDKLRITSVFGEAPPLVPPEEPFCIHVPKDGELLIVSDASKDNRFENHSWVMGHPGIRFYAGAPLVTSDGTVLGSLCVIDYKPHDLDESQQNSLKMLAKQITGQLRQQCRERAVFKRDRILNGILDSGQDCLKLLGPDGSLHMINGAGLAMIQVNDFAEVQGKCIYPLVQQPQRDAFIDLTRRVFAGESGTLEYQIIGMKGRPLWLETHATPMVDEDGEIEAYLGITRDITEKHAAAEASRHRAVILANAQSLARLGSSRYDLQSSRIEWSDEQAQLHGCSPEAFTQNFAGFLELVHPDDRDKIQKIYDDLSSIIDPVTITYRTNPGRGGPKHLKATFRVVKSENGNVLTVEGATLDITEAVQAEERISQLNRVHSMMTSINQQVVREKDLQTFLDATCRIAAKEGHFGMAWIGLVDSDDQKLKLRAHARADDDQLTALKQALSGDRPLCDVTYDAVRTGYHGVCNDIEHDPRTVDWRALALGWGFYSMASLPLKNGGQVIGTLNLYSTEVEFFDVEELRLLNELAADVSFAIELAEREEERRKVNWALRERETQLSNALKVANMAHWAYDIKAEEFVFNDQFYNLMQTSAEKQGGYRMPKTACLTHFCHPDDLETVQKNMGDALTLGAEEHICEFEYRVLNEDGGVAHLAVRLFVEQDKHGKTIKLCGVNRDITEYKLLEEEFRQSQKMEAIGQLAGGVAHDFNNILTVINGYGTMLMLGEVKGNKAQEAIEQIVKSAERAGSLTRQLLAFSRRQVMQPKVAILNELVAQLTKMIERIVGEHIKLVIDLTSELPAVYVDAGMLDQLVLNLAVNARDAMEGGGELRIRTSASATPIAGHPDVGSIVLEVSDTGCGMPPEILNRIYEPFFTTKEQGKGTGLGLSTVFGIVKQHGAGIDVQSMVGEGTSFKISFPATERLIESETDKVALKPVLERGTETILLVEDQPAVRMLGRSLLERAGYEVLEACDGHQAIEVFNENEGEIHLLFTDIVMPEGLNGRDLALRLRESQPDLRVIFTSGYSAEIAGRELGLEVGQNFIQKPSSPHVILQTVRRNLDAEAALQS